MSEARKLRSDAEQSWEQKNRKIPFQKRIRKKKNPHERDFTREREARHEAVRAKEILSRFLQMLLTSKHPHTYSLEKSSNTWRFASAAGPSFTPTSFSWLSKVVFIWYTYLSSLPQPWSFHLHYHISVCSFLNCTKAQLYFIITCLINIKHSAT